MRYSFCLILIIVFSYTNLSADWIEQQKILASDGFTDDFFGNSVAIDGDYAVVGAPVDDDNGSISGSVYIFKRINDVWTEQVKLTPSDGEEGDIFGNSVAIDGDNIIVGANWSDDNGFHSGSAYIFHRSGNTWTEVTKLTASNGGDWDEYGYSVSISGDYAVVGAYKNEVNGIQTGSAYVYKKSGRNWFEQTRLNSFHSEEGELFGFSVSIDGPYIIVGAYDYDYTGFNPSYIFHRIGDVWYEQAHLLPDDTGAYCFGKSVAISGDYAIIGAYADNINGTRSGSAYIFHRLGTTWFQQIKLTPLDGSLNDYFGLAVSISGNNAIIGAHNNDDNGSNSGSAYLFNRVGSVWSESMQKFTASDGEEGDLFGYSVCIDGENAIIGAEWDDDNGVDSGSAYFFQNESFDLRSDENQFIVDNLQLENSPNPFNPTTTISFNVPQTSSFATIEIYNLKGQQIKEFRHTELVEVCGTPNSYSVVWKGDDDNNKSVSSGIYLYNLVVDGKSLACKKCILLK
ncbi:MAG: hypothetical protein K9N09_11230 [Candidatus Cloacimonetes bacterium]|nr:hypothetical protein [Candidatus Cloacimonadota bacterium]MCF7815028.1 hypothetical protein [Candidatus Cloacimonadota bacterium]MCF7869259.1 hypothetical protein [Candidatus Cloacimonadota bacterium]MCF7884693.1 hypothetical protein [Candidatus Cloacimonadota bacterium]